MPGRTARSLRGIDATRLGQAAARPGIDPRTWVVLGRVVEVELEGGDQIVVVRADEGALAGETIVCEVGVHVASSGAFASSPIRVGDFAAVIVQGGDANNLPLVVAFSHTADTPPPKAVNGVAIDAALLAGSYVLADTERRVELELKGLRLVAEKVELGPDPTPTQPFVRGQAFADALSAWLDGCDSFGSIIEMQFGVLSQAAIGPLAPLKVPFEAIKAGATMWRSSIATLKSHLVAGDMLSTTITGE